jgi:5-methylcytosine-specific restriction protein A
MTAILGTWNLRLWQWDDIADAIVATASGRSVVDSWSVNNRRNGVNPGDRFYLLKVGKHPRGLVGSGTILSEPFRAPHWDGRPGKTTKVIDVEFDRLIDPEHVLPAAVLSEELTHTNWKPMSSGTTIHPADERPLESLWKDHLTQL